MLINIRGTNGSGKTYISHQLIDQNDCVNEVEPEWVREKHFVKPNVFKVAGGLHIVGRYKSGMDGIFPQEIVEDMIEYWAPKGHVIWENVLVSANIGRWAVLSKKIEPVNHNVWVFLDTPLQTCIDRVLARRAQAADDGFNHRQSDDEVDLNVIAGHWRRVRRATARAHREGIDVRILKNEVAYEQVHNMLMREGGWRPSPDAVEFDVPYAEKWTPSEDELELILKTARFPWEPEDTITKVDFVSKKQRPRGPITIFGTVVKRWGGGDAYEDTGVKTVFGSEIKKWPVAEVADTISSMDTEPDFFDDDESVILPLALEEQEN